MTSNDHAILRIFCDDQPGIITAVTQFVHQHGNIVDLVQHSDSTRNKFYMRALGMDDFDISHQEVRTQIQHSLSEKYRFNWKLNFTTQLCGWHFLSLNNYIVFLIF